MVGCALEGESALLDLDASRYYRLNAVGACVWDALASPKTVDQLCAAVVDTFDVEPERCALDVEALLDQMAGAGLVVISQ